MNNLHERQIRLLGHIFILRSNRPIPDEVFEAWCSDSLNDLMRIKAV